MYDLQIEFPAPPVPRELRRSRSTSGPTPLGEVVDAPSAPRSTRSPPQLATAKVEAVGVCLLNAYANPANERVVAEHLRARARRAGVHLRRDLAADPRVPADDHDGVQRGHDAGDRAVPRRAAEVAGRRGLRRFGADDAVERRRRVRRRRGARARSGWSRVGPGGRRAGRRAGSPAGSARTGCCASTWAAPPPSRA